MQVNNERRHSNECWADLLASGRRSFGFHRLGLLLARGFGSLGLLLLRRQRRVAGRAGALAVFGGIWGENGSAVTFTVLRFAAVDSRRLTTVGTEGAYWCRSRPSSAWILGWPRGRWRRDPKREATLLGIYWWTLRLKMLKCSAAGSSSMRLWAEQTSFPIWSLTGQYFKRKALTRFLSFRSFSSFFSLDRPCTLSVSFFSTSLSLLLDRATELKLMCCWKQSHMNRTQTSWSLTLLPNPH